LSRDERAKRKTQEVLNELSAIEERCVRRKARMEGEAPYAGFAFAFWRVSK
jgi:hypothetical protein